MVYSRLMDYMNHGFKFGSSVLKLQLALGACCVLIVALIAKDLNSVFSAFLGLILVLLPTLLYVFMVFRHGVVAYPKIALGRHQKAMVFRFVANFVLFLLVVISYKQCKFLWLLLTYFVTLSGYWFSLIKR